MSEEVAPTLSIDDAKEYIGQFFQDQRFTYHSIDHTNNVLQGVQDIGELEQISPVDMEMLQIAALFHDTGYVSNPTYHEEIGADNATTYLKTLSYPAERIKVVRELILSTKMTKVPQDDLQGIICDADLSHVGRKDFLEISELLRREMDVMQGVQFSDIEWSQNNLQFLSDHKWNSKGGKKLYNKKKKENVQVLKSTIKKANKEHLTQIPEKGIETMYRVALRNHNQLSKIADNKANILLSITTIMLSLIIANLATKIDSNPRLLIPTITIIAVNLVTMFFAILATRPKVSSVPYSRDVFLEGKINILFFGNFYKIPLPEFEWGMNQLMENRDLLYGSLSKDLYFLGVVLAKKYRYLQYGYAVFMVGLIIAALSFVWALVFAG